MVVLSKSIRILAPIVSIGFTACMPGPASPVITHLRNEHEPLPLRSVPSQMTLGELRPGQAAQTALHFDNVSQMTCAITRFEVTCPCIRIVPRTLSVGPGQSSKATVSFDPGESPEFRGGLTVDITAHDAEGAIVGRASVRLTVNEGPAS